MNWQYAAMAALALACGVQQLRIESLDADLARAGQAASDERVAREAAAREHAEEMAKLTHEHSVQQSTLEKNHAQKLAALDAARRSDAHELVRLRGIVAAFAASDRRPGETDAAALGRAEHRLQALAGLLDEGIQLVVESRGLVAQRDAEVQRLLNQIRLDRQVCSQDAPASQGS